MKCGGEVPKAETKKAVSGIISKAADAIAKIQVMPEAERQCVAKYDGYVKKPGSDLKSKFRSCRMAALSYMWRTKDVGKLVSALESDIADVRGRAFEHLKSIMANKPSIRQVRILTRALSHHQHSDFTRSRIIAALSLAPKVFGNRRLRRKLVSDLKTILDPKHKQSKETKLLALEAAGKLRAKKAIPEILHIIKNDDTQVRLAAIKTCLQINPRDSKEVVHALTEVGYELMNNVDWLTWHSASMAAERTLRKAYGWLYKDVSKSQDDETLFASALSGYIPTQEDINLFTLWATHKAADKLSGSPRVRLYSSIVSALGHFQASDKASMGIIKDALSSPIWHLRKTAAHTLTKVDHRDALEMLRQAISVEGRKSSYGYITLRTERLGVLRKAYDTVWEKVDRADIRNVAHYARKFKDSGTSKADRLRWVACLKEIGTKRAMRLLVDVNRNEREFAEVRQAAKKILNEKMPRHIFIPQTAEVEKREAYSGPLHGVVDIPPNLG